MATVLPYLAFLIGGGLALAGFISSPLALVLGFILAGFGLVPRQLNPGQLAKRLLAVAIVLLGFGIQLDVALAITGDALGLIVVSIVLTLVLGLLLGKWLGLETATAHLIGSGTAICGGSAIAAVGPAIRARSDQMALALAVVFILNAIALLVFPIIGRLLELDQVTFGLWSAIAIHDTSSVVGAAEAYGDEALVVATTAKLARALWIVPVALVSAWVFARSQKHKSTTKMVVPWFIGGFIASAGIASYWPEQEALFSLLFAMGKQLLVFCLFLIGLSLTLQRIRAAGLKPLLLAVMLWLIIAVGSLVWLTTNV
ncbi:YeiH family protein [Pseudidiomarina terrestris]|uniref:YeiH family protein n=1 Tax=Pseudidiomarina terrestris TaxID=2820060 RepID=UPI002651F73D|nr:MULTISPECIES: putative sulfate exporter family transporter [unclassified Pseudidiomarina]MDN7128045.1 putative sulfate exporter family transporter [Pseudidiomarina sp. 1APR75-33.1]MDN7135704.1 putative sulfate exporter family transporter [Pseudidiomarina sp. 1ASP75-5]MDN7137258.1 putative sulfate exporter family transporter [Pseudidiomarina sp. 1ASP75-14]